MDRDTSRTVERPAAIARQNCEGRLGEVGNRRRDVLVQNILDVHGLCHIGSWRQTTRVVIVGRNGQNSKSRHFEIQCMKGSTLSRLQNLFSMLY
jgi:hypothetical protein